MAMYINSETGIKIALIYDAPEEDWGQHINFTDIVSEEYPLKPITWSESRKSFVTLHYGIDGRSTGNLLALTDQRNANRNDANGFYVVGRFFAKTDATCNISLAEAVSVADGTQGAGTFVMGVPIWEADRLLHKNGGMGAENAIRIGLRFTPIDETTGEPDGDPVFFIYEPNCSGHQSGTIEYYKTPSIDGADLLIDENHLILQDCTTWTESYPVERDVTVKSYGAFIKNHRLYTLETGKKVRIEIYIWLEGQDMDCINSINDAKLLANIQFDIDYEGHSGIDDIPD